MALAKKLGKNPDFIHYAYNDIVNIPYRQTNNENKIRGNFCSGIEDPMGSPMPIVQFLDRALGVHCHLDLIEFGYRYPGSLIGPLLDNPK